jgi:hypothetical protein
MPIFSPKIVKIAENCDHNINPRVTRWVCEKVAQPIFVKINRKYVDTVGKSSCPDWAKFRPIWSPLSWPKPWLPVHETVAMATYVRTYVVLPCEVEFQIAECHCVEFQNLDITY